MSRPPAPRRPIVPPRGGKVAPGAVRKPPPGGRVGTSAKGVAEDGYLYLAGIRDPSKRITEFRARPPTLRTDEQADTDVCPVCKTDRQFNKNLRLLVSPCYHKMCESCIDRIFALGPEPCPTCGKILRKNGFQPQSFEDLRVEKEVAVRRRMAGIFNKREDDFPNSREYDDYLENVENLTFNLLNDVDVDATERELAVYAKKNASSIAVNQEKAAIESLSQSERDDLDKRAREERMRMVEESERIERAEEDKMRAAIVDALASGNRLKADEIRRDHEIAKAGRVEAFAKALPPSLVKDEEEEVHEPGSPRYHGVFVPMPYGDVDDAVWKGWYTLEMNYADNRSGVIAAKEDKDGKFRGGAWDVGLFWEMEIRAAVESLGIEPLT